MDGAFRYVSDRTDPSPDRETFANWLGEIDTWLAMGSESAVNSQLPWRGLVSTFDKAKISPQEAVQAAEARGHRVLRVLSDKRALPDLAPTFSILKTLLDLSVKFEQMTAQDREARSEVSPLQSSLDSIQATIETDIGWLTTYLAEVVDDLLGAIEKAQSGTNENPLEILDYRRRIGMWGERRLHSTWGIDITISEMREKMDRRASRNDGIPSWLPTMSVEELSVPDIASPGGSTVIEAGPGQGKSSFTGISCNVPSRYFE